MATPSIDIKKLSPVIGAELHGIDLSQPLDDATFNTVHEMLLDHQVIFFRNQDLSIERQKAFGQRFGSLYIHPAAPKVFPEHPELFVIHADENSRVIARHTWHSDISFEAYPPMGSILYLTEVAETGGDMLFSSMYAAYEALSEPMQKFLNGLNATHAGEKLYRDRYDAKEPDKDYPESVHPIVRTHPVTGRRALFVNEAFTTKITDMPKWESDAILEFLFKHVQLPQFQCRFQWQPNSIAFWDNRCVQHHALWDYYPQVRHGHRITINGDQPFFTP